MSLTTPSRNNPNLDGLLAGLKGIDFAAPGAPDPGETLYMLGQRELKAKRTSDEGTALRDQIRHWRSQADAQRIVFEQQWLQNLDMYEGRQFHRWDPSTRTTVATQRPEGTVRVPMNFIQPIIRTELAKTASSHPTASVQPASNDDADILAARAAEAVWEWAYNQEKIQSKVLNQANFWRAITGNGFMKVFIDLHAEDVAATAAAKATYEEELTRPQPLAGMLGQPPEPTKIFGKVAITSVNPFHLYFGDLMEPDIQKQPWIIQAALIPVERAKLIYKDVMPKDWVPKKVNSSVVFDYTRLGMRTDATGVDQTLVLEAWIQPNVTEHLPEGGLVIIVDDEIVAMSEDGLPYEHGRLPYQHIYTVETGRFYRNSVVNALTPLQDEFNTIFGQLIEYKNKASQPRWFYRSGALDPTKVRNWAGQWIPVTLGMDYPKMLDLPDIPSYVMNLVDAIKTVVDDISGQHQVSRAISPGADTAASAISILREADDDYLSNTQDSIETAVEEMAQQYLTCAVQAWKEPRLIKIAGDNERTSAELLVGADIATGTDIRTTVGSGLPQSRSARQALVKELMDGQYIDPALGLKVIGEGALGKLFNQLTVDEDQAERENIAMAKMTEQELEERNATNAQALQEFAAEDPETAALAAGVEGEGMVQPPAAYPINEFDNDEIHLKVHERRMKSQEWDGYEPWRKQMFLDHWRAHSERLAASMAPAPMPGDEAGSQGNVPAQGGDESYDSNSGAGQGAPSDEMRA